MPINMKSFPWRARLGLFLIFIVSMGLIHSVRLFPSFFYQVYPPARYLVFHNLVEGLSVIISLQIFLLSWVTYKQTQNFRSLFIGMSFLGVALLDIFHIFSFPGMPGLLTPASTHKGIYFWLGARLWAVGALLSAGFLPDKKDYRSRSNLLAAVLALVALIVLIDAFWGNYVPLFFIEGRGLTPLKIILEYLVIALGLGALFVYGRLYVKEPAGSLLYLMAGLIITVISEVCFTFYSSAFDIYNLLGHIYKFTAYGLFSYALFIVQIRQPYNLLESAHRNLAQSKKELEKAFLSWQRTFEGVSDGVWLMDPDGRILQSNGKFELLLGIKTEDAINRHCFECAHGSCDFIKNCPAARIKQLNKRETEEIEDKERGIWLEVTVDPIHNQAGELTGVIHIVRDITERKRAEEALRNSEQECRLLSAQLMMAQEKERKRIAQELHDGLGQTLSAIKFRLEHSLLSRSETLAAENIQPLRAVVPMIQETVEEVRRICMDLRPSTLDDLGILATTAWFCREFEKSYPGILVEPEINLEEKEVPLPLKTVIYRVLQEALNNIAKHSQAQRVRLGLVKIDGRLEVVIEDDGRGFSLEEVLSRKSSQRGMGLGSMKERVELSGGAFTIESVEGAGTRIQAAWAL